MRLLDSSVGVFAITSLGALITVANLLWSMGFIVLHSCTSGTVIVRGKGCCESGTFIPLFKDHCSTKDESLMACAVMAL
jgi:hypothetical protein